MMMGASSVEEHLASMARAVEKLSKTIKEKDLQITALVNKLESQNIGETNQVNNNKSDQNPQMDDSAKVYFRSSSRNPVDDNMNLLATEDLEDKPSFSCVEVPILSSKLVYHVVQCALKLISEVMVACFVHHSSL
ncbi:hypothetical protein ACH5RR_015579 [Cinchona calisaya]|uniref:Uncharacterized protein n=1 Tax=Cinchona calisaya TaxID=153742 RepID=A0ABD2ZWP0_9GENT